MKAVQVDDTKAMHWQETTTPTPGQGEVLIKVHATAINRADLLQRHGGYPPPPGASPVLGLECAGEIADLGDGVSRFKAGDRVCALLAGG
ncbi:MAG: alcohol dehydrogenase catalytic domain-containing protein, partial [Pseudomonadales bacterium]